MTTFTSKEISKVTGINHNEVLEAIKQIAKNKNIRLDYDCDDCAFVSEELALLYAIRVSSIELIDFIENSQLDEIQVGFENEAFEL